MTQKCFIAAHLLIIMPYKTDKKELFSQQFLFYSIKSAFNAKLTTEVTSGFDSYYKVI